jgi:putative toxin-antitoxin system antitoxin component (TIGR02293 family)
MSVSPTLPHSVRVRFQSLDLTSAFDIVFSARKGIKTKVFYDFAESIKMPEKNLAMLLNLSARTISNYKEQRKTLEPVQSEHLLKLITLFGKGEEIFGNVDEFNYWLQKPFWNARERPLDWLITPGGVDLVMDELDRLSHGYAV